MKIVEFTAEMKGFEGRYANIGVRRGQCTENPLILALAFEGILKCMNDTCREAFYIAMSEFVDDKEYDVACEFLEGHKNE